VLRSFGKRLSYSNVTATAALFIALGGTSYAVTQVDSGDIADNSLRSADLRNNSVRSRDIRDRTVQARDLRRNGLGGGAVKEGALGKVPLAANAERLGGTPAIGLRVRCPADTAPRAGVCIESSARPGDGFFGATSACDHAGRGLPTMAQLDRFAVTGALSPAGEWTSSVYRNPDNGAELTGQLEAVVLTPMSLSYERVYLAVQHAFRCVALPSN
jgi:hypothetical protein